MKHLWFKSRSKHSNQWKASLRDFVLNVKILDFSSSKIHRSNILLNSAQRKPLNRLSLGKLNVQVAFIQKHNVFIISKHLLEYLFSISLLVDFDMKTHFFYLMIAECNLSQELRMRLIYQENWFPMNKLSDWSREIRREVRGDVVVSCCPPVAVSALQCRARHHHNIHLLSDNCWLLQTMR